MHGGSGKRGTGGVQVLGEHQALAGEGMREKRREHI